MNNNLSWQGTKKSGFFNKLEEKKQRPFSALSFTIAIAAVLLWDWKNISFYLLVGIVIIFLLITVFLFKRYHFDIPVLIFLTFYVLSNFLGIFGSFIYKKYWPSYPVEIFLPFRINSIAFISIVIGLWVAAIFGKRSIRSEKKYIYWNTTSLKKLRNVAFLLYVPLTIYYIVAYHPPLLQNDFGYNYNSLIMSVKGFDPILKALEFSSIFLTFVTILLIVLDKRKSKTWWDYVVFAFILFSITLRGSRFLAFIAVLLLLFAYNSYKKKVTVKQLLVLGLLSSSLMFLFVPLREGVTVKEFLGGKLPQQLPAGMNVTEYVAIKLFPEYTSFGEMLYRYPDGELFPSYTLKSILYTPLPKQFWELLGIDKSEQVPNVSWLVSDYLDKGLVGIRVGLVGEIYLDEGIVGVILTGLIIGFVLSLFDAYHKQLLHNSPNKFLILLISTILVYMIIGEFTNMIANLYYWLYLVVAIRFLFTKKVQSFSISTEKS